MLTCSPTEVQAAERPQAVQTIADSIAAQAQARGASPALIGIGAQPVTFTQLLSSISSIAQDLAQAGLRRDDLVGLLVPSGIAGGRLMVALASNITVVPVNPALTLQEMTEVAKVSGLTAIVIPSGLASASRSAMLEQPLAVFEASERPDGAPRLELLTKPVGPPVPVRAGRDTDVALLLRSSGTTGAAKLIPVTHRNLLAMAEKLGSGLWFGLSARDRAACTLPLYYAAGIKTSLFVPLILGASVGFPPAGQASDVAAWIDVLKPTFLSVSPGSLNGILDRLKMAPHPPVWGSVRFVMCGAGYLPEEVRLAAQRLLQVPILEFYGLSEAGVMAANPVPPGKSKPGTVGLPAPGELLIVDDSHQPVANGMVGEIMVGGPSVTPGYIAEENSAGEFNAGWLLTGDLGRIDEDGYLTIVGRTKEVINRGGEKIFPYEIEKAMLQHPAVADAAAFGVPHARLGESVAAAAVLKTGSTVSEQELKEFLAARLAAFKLPRRLWLVSSLPRGNTGKVLRSALTESYGARRRQFAQPDGLLESELFHLWSRLLGTDDIGIDDDFFEKGGDSLLATEMLLEVEQLTGKPYPQSELSTLTIRRIAHVITSGLAAARELITQVKSGSGIPLFLCHGDYVTRGLYAHKLAALLPEGQPVFLLHSYADQFGGQRMEDVAQVYLEQILRAGQASPVFVAGYCNGGLTAWHLTHLLRAQGVEVLELVLIDTASLNARTEMRTLARIAGAAASLIPGRPGKLLRQDGLRAAWIFRRRSLRTLARLSYRAVRRKAISVGRRGTLLHGPRDAASEADKAFYRMMSRYVPPPVDVDLTCVIAEDGTQFDTDPQFWRPLVRALRVVRVPGTHTTALITGRQALAQALAEVMQRATARSARVAAPAAPQSGA